MPGSPEADLVQQSRREGIISLSVWVLAAAYTVGYCYLYGYGRSAESLEFVFGFPDWVFWGVLVPWGACTLFSLWFSSYYMTDYDWGESDMADAEDALWHSREEERGE